jgi:hypothetical protein
MRMQRELVAEVLEAVMMRSSPRPGHIATAAERETARLLLDAGLVSVRGSDEDGCGFWLPSEDDDRLSAAPAEWWSCVIPDTEHSGRDHVLVRRVRRGR